MYSGELRRLVFRGIRFSECSFARAKFVEVTFRRCKFKKVDLTRALFRDCHFSDCIFENCDPYNCSFLRTVVDPAAFKPCYGEKVEIGRLSFLRTSSLGLKKLEMGDWRVHLHQLRVNARSWRRIHPFMEWVRRDCSYCLARSEPAASEA